MFFSSSELKLSWIVFILLFSNKLFFNFSSSWKIFINFSKIFSKFLLHFQSISNKITKFFLFYLHYARFQNHWIIFFLQRKSLLLSYVGPYIQFLELPKKLMKFLILKFQPKNKFYFSQNFQNLIFFQNLCICKVNHFLFLCPENYELFLYAANFCRLISVWLKRKKLKNEKKPMHCS